MADLSCGKVAVKRGRMKELHACKQVQSQPLLQENLKVLRRLGKHHGVSLGTTPSRLKELVLG